MKVLGLRLGLRSQIKVHHLGRNTEALGFRLEACKKVLAVFVVNVHVPPFALTTTSNPTAWRRPNDNSPKTDVGFKVLGFMV